MDGLAEERVRGEEVAVGAEEGDGDRDEGEHAAFIREADLRERCRVRVAISAAVAFEKRAAVKAGAQNSLQTADPDKLLTFLGDHYCSEHQRKERGHLGANSPAYIPVVGSQ